MFGRKTQGMSTVYQTWIYLFSKYRSADITPWYVSVGIQRLIEVNRFGMFLFFKNPPL